MGTEGIITVTCDCGRKISAKRELAGQQMDCPVCGAVVLIPLDQIDQSGPLCPHCGRPWPATDLRCPSCLSRNRTVKNAEQDAQRKFSNRFGTPSIEPELEDEDDSGLDLEDMSEAELSARPTRIVLPGLMKLWDKPSAQGWYIATAVVALTALVAVFRGGFGSGGMIWLGAGIIYALTAFGMYRGIVMARNLVCIVTLFGGLILMAVAIFMSPQTVKIAGAVMTAISLLISLAGFRILTGKIDNPKPVIVGGAFLFAGLMSLMISAGTAGLRLHGDGLASIVKAQDKDAEPTTYYASESTENKDTYEASANHDAEDTATDTHTQAGQSLYDNTQSSNTSAYTNLDSKQNNATENSDEEILSKNDPSAKPKRQQWLDMIKKRGVTPKFPLGADFSNTSVRLPLSPIMGTIKMDCIRCDMENAELFLMCSSARPKDEISDSSKIRELLEWTATTAAKHYAMKVEDRHWRSSPSERLIVKLAPDGANSSMEGKIQTVIVEGQILVYGGVYERNNVRQRTATNALIASLKDVEVDQ